MVALRRNGLLETTARFVQMILAHQQEAQLIGGVRIQVGGDVYNGTVQGRLAALQQSA